MEHNIFSAPHLQAQMQFNKNSVLSSALVGIFLLYACVLGSLVSSRPDLEAFEYGRRTTLPGFSRRYHQKLGKRALDPPVPTVDVCKGKLSVDKDKAVFYSSAVEESAKAYASSIGNFLGPLRELDPYANIRSGGKTIWEAGLTDLKTALEARAKEVIDGGGQSWTAEDGADFFINCSKAFALIAQGTVTAVLPAGTDGNVQLPEGSYFTVYEWPILKDPSQNSNVEKVVGLVGNTDGTAPNGQLKQIWPCGT